MISNHYDHPSQEVKLGSHRPAGKCTSCEGNIYAVLDHRTVVEGREYERWTTQFHSNADCVSYLKKVLTEKEVQLEKATEEWWTCR